jgi:hypothetical protein
MAWWGQTIDQMTPEDRARLRSVTLHGALGGAAQAAGSRDFAMAAPAQALAMLAGGATQGGRAAVDDVAERDIQGAHLDHLKMADQMQAVQLANAMRQQQAMQQAAGDLAQSHPELAGVKALLPFVGADKLFEQVSGGSPELKATIAHQKVTEDLARQQLAATMTNEQASRQLQAQGLAQSAAAQKMQQQMERARLGLEAQGQERQLAVLQNSQKQQGFTQANQLRDQFNTLTKDVRDAPTNFNKIKSGFDMATGAGDIAGLTAYMKMLDPTSVVREGEFATAANAGGVSEWIRNLYNKAKSGQILAPEVRQQLLGAAAGQVKAYKGKYDGLTKNYTEFATRAGLDPKDVINPVEFPNLSPLAPPAPGATQTVPNPVAPDYSAFGF